ncbi:CocE/NonD family hydrolase [Stenotrophomonas mori]|uniref:CocE/NonD family hydrolase n=1 Tax=Stenotrophomonas mori TaxID=2871096 RepID=A0ABT0SG30_9GAMM|nr:CocE/NonD family hydrolase [Stenotrophomonas mori]MCL7714285.1 CocE/NonD family hydrolase [Stenotrophomonas mori]
MKTRTPAVLLSAALLVLSAAVPAQDLGRYSEEGLRAELAGLADVETAVLVPMRDGIGLSTNIWRPKGATGPLPTVLWKTPYNEHSPRGTSARLAIEALRNGYAFVVQSERGRYLSQGRYQILGHPQTDGYDALSWIAAQPWSNGKVGTLGCSSSAEWQLSLAAMDHPAHAAMVPMAAGAGIGKVGPFQEQGNFYTGGVPRTLFAVWMYGVDNPLRAELPQDLAGPLRARVAQYNDLDAKKPAVDWQRHIRHLPYAQLLSSLGEPPATFERMIGRGPADPAWEQGGLYRDSMGWGVPALWFNSWYDVSIGPNLALFNHARAAGTDAQASQNQYVVIGPNPHCQFWQLGKDYTVGDRAMGDASFPVSAQIWAFFDRWLKNQPKAFPASTPHVRYFTMGANRWQSDAQWPPQAARPVRLYLRSGGAANSLYGDGRLTFEAPSAEEPKDSYRYDPANPVQTIGGGDCCNGGLVTAGAFDQRPVEARHDVLVYTSAPLDAPLEVSGFVDAVLQVSSSARDTDFALKLVDVAPDDTAWIIGDTILRARYRDGYAAPAPMQPGQVYTLKPTPITTSIRFGKGHRIRVEVTSSNFPKFARNLNTGGANESEDVPVVADNAVHHSAAAASYIELPVVEHSKP